MNQPSLDLASFIAAIFAVFIAPPLAHVMGVYTAIIVGAVFGAGLALVRAKQMKRGAAVRFVLLMVGVSVVTTVGTAEFINHWLKFASVTPLLAPVALLIAAIGHDWPKFAAEAWRRMWRLAELMKGGNPTDEYTGYSRRTRGRFTRPDDREGADRE